MFENVSDLMRHVKRWCPENSNLKPKREDDNDGIPFKRYKIDVQIEDGDDIAFNKLARSTREETEDQWEAKVDKYLNDGVTESEAKYKANRKLRQDELHKFVWKYKILVQYLLQLWVGKLHSIVKHMVDELIEDGMDYKKDIQFTVRKYRHIFENLLD
jgi:hypothetical protein